MKGICAPKKPTIAIIINNLIISPQKWSAICRARDMKLYIISNRLPVKVSEKNGTFSFTRSEGGLATKSIGSGGREFVWIMIATNKRSGKNWKN